MVLEQVTCGRDACVIDWQIPIFLTLMVWRAEEYLQDFQNSRFCMNKAVKALNYWICFSGVQHLEDISLDDFSSSNNYINKNFNWILSQFIQNFVGHIFKTNQVRPCLLFSKISSFYHNTQGFYSIAQIVAVLTRISWQVLLLYKLWLTSSDLLFLSVRGVFSVSPLLQRAHIHPSSADCCSIAFPN